MRNAFLGQEIRQVFRGFNGNRTNQDWLALAVAFLNVSHHCLEFRFKTWIELVWRIHPLYWTVGWDYNHVHAVDFAEFFFLGLGRPGHP